MPFDVIQFIEIQQIITADSDSKSNAVYVAGWKCLESSSLFHTRRNQFRNILCFHFVYEIKGNIHTYMYGIIYIYIHYICVNIHIHIYIYIYIKSSFPL